MLIEVEESYMDNNILLEIYEGWKNYIFPTPHVEEVAKNRIKLCVKCNYLNKRKICKKCGCYMPAKVRNLKSKCKLNYW